MNDETGRIISNILLAPHIREETIYAPLIAKAIKPGQFVIVIVDEKGERIPLTPVEWNVEEKWIKIVFLEIGVSTIKLGLKKRGDKIYYIVGPLGNPSMIKNYGTVVMIGGGVGVPSLYPIAKALRKAGNKIISIIGARSANLLVYEDKIRSISDEIYITTDDGSKGMKGFTSDALKIVLEEKNVDIIWVIGPAIMMKVCSDISKSYNVKTIVSLNSIMVCGMGMCGACRVKVGGETKYTCIDGPEFDGHLVDWNEFLSRLKAYRPEEKIALDRFRKILEKGEIHG